MKFIVFLIMLILPIKLQAYDGDDFKENVYSSLYQMEKSIKRVGNNKNSNIEDYKRIVEKYEKKSKNYSGSRRL